VDTGEILPEMVFIDSVEGRRTREYARAKARKFVGDFDGDGAQGFLAGGSRYSGSNQVNGIWFGRAKNAYLLNRVEDGMGLEHRLSYDRQSYEPGTSDCGSNATYCVKQPPPLVSRVQIFERTNDGQSVPRYSQIYTYADLRRGVDGRGSYGMRQREVATAAPNGVVSSITRETYNNDSFELAGTLKSRETRWAQVEESRIARRHARIARVENDWVVRESDAGRPFPFAERTETTVLDEDNDATTSDLIYIGAT